MVSFFDDTNRLILCLEAKIIVAAIVTVWCLAYFDPKNCTLKQKSTIFSQVQESFVFILLGIYNFVMMLLAHDRDIGFFLITAALQVMNIHQQQR